MKSEARLGERAATMGRLYAAAATAPDSSPQREGIVSDNVHTRRPPVAARLADRVAGGFAGLPRPFVAGHRRRHRRSLRTQPGAPGPRAGVRLPRGRGLRAAAAPLG